MSSDDIEPFDWYGRFGRLGRRGFGGGVGLFRNTNVELRLNAQD